MDNAVLDKINRFTRRPMKEEEVYVFSVVLCDNEIDRDCERFSDEALAQLCEGFIGRTGISDHDPSAANQTARIFDACLVTDESRKNRCGMPYKYLKAQAYMVRTDENRDLIAEIDGGIKKEVSISCSAEKKTCSVCGCDRNTSGCSHIRGKYYGGKLCHTVLSGITDTYEWSFVAVPAQVNAGVTKHFSSTDVTGSPAASQIAEADEELRRDIRRLAYFSGGREAADSYSLACRDMDTSRLISLKKSLESRRKRNGIEVQLTTGSTEDAAEGFSMK